MAISVATALTSAYHTIRAFGHTQSLSSSRVRSLQGLPPPALFSLSRSLSVWMGLHLRLWGENARLGNQISELITVDKAFSHSWHPFRQSSRVTFTDPWTDPSVSSSVLSGLSIHLSLAGTQPSIWMMNRPTRPSRACCSSSRTETLVQPLASCRFRETSMPSPNYVGAQNVLFYFKWRKSCTFYNAKCYCHYARILCAKKMLLRFKCFRWRP